LPSVCEDASTTVLNGIGSDDDASLWRVLNKNVRGEAGEWFDGSNGTPNSVTGCEHGELCNRGPGRGIALVPTD
jgi:hypothetical protein